MISALISFFGGSAFRMLWGEISAFITARQEHKHELERLRLQAEIDAAQHARNLEAIKLQHDLGVDVIEVQAEADAGRIETSAWAEVVGSTTRLTGIKFIDIWNGAIRPMLASLAILFVCLEIIDAGLKLSEWNRELFAAILGIYLADRQLQKRGK